MAILTRSSALIDRGHRVHRSTREDRVKFAFFAAENGLLARVQSSSLQSDSFWLLRGSPCAFLDALFLRCIVRFLVLPIRTRRLREISFFAAENDLLARVQSSFVQSDSFRLVSV